MAIRLFSDKVMGQKRNGSVKFSYVNLEKGLIYIYCTNLFQWCK